MDSNQIINDYLAYSNISVPTKVSLTILKQSEIITIMNDINKIDVSILERKISDFIGNNELLKDESSIVLITFLCCLMYKNDIFPQYIYDVLKEMNITDVSIEELKQNSENLINMLLGNSIGGGKKGGANFNVIYGALWNISFVLIISLYDYYYLTNKAIPKIYEKAINIVSETISISQNMNNCEYIQIPPTIRYLDKYVINKNFGVENIYRSLSCIANRDMDNYLQDEIFMPQNIQKSNFAVVFSDIEKKSKQITEDIATHSLVPEGYNFDVQQQIVLLNTQLQPVLSNIENTMNELMVYKDLDNENLDLDKTMVQLKRYEEMSEDELLNLLYPQTDIISKKKTGMSETSIIANAYEFAKDTFSLLYYTSQKVAEETGNINAIDITKQWIWIFKDYIVQKIRDIEDIKRKTDRNISDFIKEANRTKENILDFLNVLKWLIPANCYMIAIISSWIINFINKIKNRSNKDTIESSQLAIENGNFIDNDIRGGKSKKNKRKIINNKRKTIKRKRKTNNKRKTIKRKRKTNNKRKTRK
jgi:hypothetical protein